MRRVAVGSSEYARAASEKGLDRPRKVIFLSVELNEKDGFPVS
jgi:hypothetical protein